MTGTLELFAGQQRGEGNADGVGNAARFRGPFGLAADAGGNLYVADTGNSTIRKITAAGEVTTFAGVAGESGNIDGVGSAARFRAPRGVSVDPLGNIYVADSGNNAIRRITASGAVSTLAPAPFSDANNVLSVHFIAADAAGNVYVAEPFQFVVWRITAGGQASIFAGVRGQGGYADGPGAAARFGQPTSLAVDAAGNVLVADVTNHVIRKITPAGIVSTFAGRADAAIIANGPIATATFNVPDRLSFDAIGNLYLLDVGPESPPTGVMRRISPSGMVTTYPNDGALVGGTAIAAEPNGNSVYVLDWFYDVVRRVGPGFNSYVFAGATSFVVHLDGIGGNAFFVSPGSLATDMQGNVFVADAEVIRKITPAAQVTTFASTYADALATDAAGNLFGTYAFCPVFPRGPPPPCTGSVFRVSAGGITALVISSSSDGTGTSIERPLGLAIDAGGNLYIADASRHVIRKLTPGGDLTTVASGFTGPNDLAIDRSGNLYVADGAQVRKVVGGAVTTLATGFNTVSGLAVDADGNVYASDALSHVVRRITPSGTVSTIVGTPGVQGFHPGPLPGVLSAPWKLALSGRNLYVATGSIVAVVRDLP